ncbi:MAG TPA: amidohydrolase family protein [Streptosporangiaceae bacterium]|nr:amidohydrolase family protein [Streptosporangiaceae bacterium]
MALCGGTVVLGLDPAEVASADVVIEGDRIAAVGAAPPGVPRRDCSGTLVLPGNVCAHTHLYSALSRGMPYRLAPPGNFLQILQRIWWRLDRALDEPSLRMSALAGGLDALLAGTTTVFDHHASPNFIDGSLDVIAAALGELGLRSVLCYEVTDRDGPGRAAAGIAENARFLKGGGEPLARGLMGAHASFTLSDATLEACAGTAAAAGAGVHIHVAEDAADQRDARAGHGRGVVDRLSAAGVVTDRALLAHCVHVDEREREVLLASGATIAHNARSNMNNGVGHSPVSGGGPPDSLAGGGESAGPRGPGRIALGTDGIGGDMITESQAAFFRAREASLLTSPSWPLARLAAGAGAAGQVFGEPLLGRITPGAPADLTVLGYAAPTPLSADTIAGHWVFGLSPGQVRDVVVAGELVIADRRSTRVDQAALAAEAAAQAGRMWARLEDIPPHEFAPQGGEAR